MTIFPFKYRLGRGIKGQEQGLTCLARECLHGPRHHVMSLTHCRCGVGNARCCGYWRNSEMRRANCRGLADGSVDS